MQKRRLIYTAIKRPLLKVFLTFTCSIKDALYFLYHSVFNPWPQDLFPSHAMKKAQGTRLIVCCLEVLPLRPFTFFVYCRMRSLILGLSVGWSEKKKRPKKKLKRRSLERGGLVPLHNNMRTLEMPCIRRLSPQYMRQSKIRCPTDTIRK